MENARHSDEPVRESVMQKPGTPQSIPARRSNSRERHCRGGTSICPWQEQQYFSQSHLSSVMSHCMQRYLVLLTVAISEL